ncbi:hypothetical protein CSAL01_10728 [Colletotrichum salicis]|uniref:Uncharacterized protein n=1 Tax=Colletotrichum salicis TaxID=1209931 RepID=A0A135UIL1_9PEZI|nr:hypothetical protein CSAL01_10728 [Colletotrichum salicis]
MAGAEHSLLLLVSKIQSKGFGVFETKHHCRCGFFVTFIVSNVPLSASTVFLAVSIGQKKDDDGKKFKSCTTGEQPRDWATNRRMICQAPSGLQVCMSQFGANAQDGLDEPCVAWPDDSSPNDGFFLITVWRCPPRTISDFGHHPALHWLPPCRSRGIGREHLAHWRNPSPQQILSSTQGYSLQQMHGSLPSITGAHGSPLLFSDLSRLLTAVFFSTSENTPPWLRAQRSPPRGGTETQRADFILTNAVDLFTQVICTYVV